MKDENNIIHIDMDAFFASVEEKYNLALKKLPIAICGKITNRGVVSTANYNARKFGVHSAMSIITAQKLCPQLHLIEGNFQLYKKESAAFEQICSKYTPDYEKTSIDELYLDVSKSHLLYGTTIQIAKKIQTEIKKNLKLNCSIGISFNKLFAKIASDLNKPYGFTVISKKNFKEILFPLKINKIPGIGKKSGSILNSYKIFTIKDLYNSSKKILTNILGLNGEKLYYAVHGLTEYSITPPENYKEKSISNETTLNFDTTDYSILKKIMITLVEKVSERLREKNLKGKTIKVKVKYFDFYSTTRQISLNVPDNKTEIFLKYADALLEPLIVKPIRLIGFGITNLTEPHGKKQLYLFETTPKHVPDETIDKMRKKFGADIIKKATMLE